jgi:hypothetical protein
MNAMKIKREKRKRGSKKISILDIFSIPYSSRFFLLIFLHENYHPRKSSFKLEIF